MRVTRILTALASFCLFFEPSSFAATPKDAVVVALDARPKSIDPRYVNLESGDRALEELLFLSLMTFDEGGSLKPLLAESVTPTGKTTFRVKLRSGLRFANGKPISAEDVVATYEFFLSSKTAPTALRKEVSSKLTGIKKLSQAEVEFTLSGPDATFVQSLNVGILPKEAVLREPDKIFELGFESGPYVLDKISEDEWIFKRNETYKAFSNAPASPKLRRAIFKILPDSGARLSALLKSDVDVIQNALDSDKVIDVQKNHASSYVVSTRTSLNTSYLGFNLHDPFLKDKTVRQAIAYAIDRKEIIRYGLQNLAQPAAGFFPVGSSFFVKEIQNYGYSLEKAKKLLSSTKLKTNSKSTLSIKVTTQKEQIAVAKGIAGQLKRVGIDAHVQAVEANEFTKQLDDGMVQAWIGSWNNLNDGDSLRKALHSKQIPPVGFNRGGYVNSRVDALLEKGTEEYDTEKRINIYAEAQTIVADDVPFVSLWHKLNHAVTAKNVRGYKLYANESYVSLTNVTKD